MISVSYIIFCKYYYSKKKPKRLEFKKIKVDPTPLRDMKTHSKRGWGYADTIFDVNEKNQLILTGNRYDISGKPLPNFIPYFQDQIGVTVDITKLAKAKYEIKKELVVSRVAINEIDEWVLKNYPNNKSSLDKLDRIIHSHGHNHEDMYNMRNGFGRIVDIVVWAENELDVRKLMKRAAESDNICIIPYGGGTNVTSALECLTDEKRCIVSLDMSRMNNVEWIDTETRMAKVEAGITGIDLDIVLKKYGYHSGHEPDSNEFSTLGGWIATAASGMKQSRYGNIEDIVMSVTLITPSGDLQKFETHSRTSTNFDMKRLIIGSEGNLGIVTSAIIRINQIPEKQVYDSILFHSFKDGTKFLRHLAQTKAIPASIRLVDNRQFQFGQAIKPGKSIIGKIVSYIQKLYVLKFKGFDKDKMSACTIVFEGDAEEVTFQKNTISKLVPLYNGMLAGAESGKSGYNLTYAIAYIRDIAQRIGVTAESFETTVPWNNINKVCSAVEKKVYEQHKKYNLAGKPYISWRISQIYPQSVCIYFYYAFYSKGMDKPAEIYSKIEKSCRQSILDNGGSLSHHHGIGKIRQPFINQVFNGYSMEILKEIKKKIDPKNIMCANNGAICLNPKKNFNSKIKVN